LSAQTIYEPITNITYYVRENPDASVAPYYLFSTTPGGTALNSASIPLTLITGNNYTFIPSTTIGTTNSNGFNVGDTFKTNNVSINVSSSGTGIPTGASGFPGYNSIINTNEQLSFSFPRLFSLTFQYFNSSEQTRILPFFVADKYSIAYIKRIS